MIMNVYGLVIFGDQATIIVSSWYIFVVMRALQVQVVNNYFIPTWVIPAWVKYLCMQEFNHENH